jgi:hypothetical protein
MRVPAWRTVAAALAAAAVLAGGAAAAPRDWGPGVELRVVGEAKPAGDAARTWRTFAGRKLYFGAYVWNPVSGAASFWRNVPALEDAVALATADCQRLSAGRGGRCTLHAVMVPRGFPPGRLKGRGLAQDAARVWRGDYARKSKGAGYAAFAASGLGDHGYAWGYATRDQAEEAASLQCLAGMAQTMADYDTAMRRIVQNRGVNQCAVVDVRGP